MLQVEGRKQSPVTVNLEESTMKSCAVVLALAMSLCLSAARGAEPIPAVDLGSAVAVLRKINAEGLTEKQKEAKGEEIEEACKRIQGAGPKGLAALKDELKKLDASKEKDDRFKLLAAAMLWEMGRMGEADTVAAIWSSADLTVNYNYVFFTACQAATTRDVRVLPMLKAMLRDQKGEAFIVMHSLPVKWPLSHAFAWGILGSQGVPVLERVLAESKDETERSSALALLAAAHDAKALESIRLLARRGSGPFRLQAVTALGAFGHPSDFEFLEAGLKSKDPQELWSFAYALYEYEDLRAVGPLVALLSTEDERLWAEVTACLEHLAAPEGLAALEKQAAAARTAERRERSRKAADRMLKALGVSGDEYAAKTPKEKAALFSAAREKAEEEYRLRPTDRKMTHEDLVKGAAEWRKNRRISGGTYAWAEDRHVLSVATAADVPLLLDVAGACCERLSDECLYEVRTIQGLIRRLVRGQHRAEPGLCEEVKPPGPR
jgi:hypothetical protein